MIFRIMLCSNISSWYERVCIVDVDGTVADIIFFTAADMIHPVIRQITEGRSFVAQNLSTNVREYEHSATQPCLMVKDILEANQKDNRNRLRLS